jgi:hypothetical protein
MAELMARPAIHCPGCNAVIGHRRQNGNIRPLVAVAPDGDAAWLCCPCGERLYLVGVRVLLFSSRKSS